MGAIAYLSVRGVQYLGDADLARSFLPYASSAFFLIGVADAGGMMLFTRLTGPVPLRLFGVSVLIGLTVPIAVDMLHRSLGHVSLIPHPMPDVILVQSFTAWLLIAYSYFLLGRVSTFVSAKNPMFSSLAGLIYIGVGVMLLYTVGNRVYQHISFSEEALLRGISTSVGAIGGLLALASSLRIASATKVQPSPLVDLDRVKTGIPELDTALGGGLPRPTSIVVMGETGSGKTTLTQRMIINRLVEDDGVLFLCLDNTPEDIRESMRMTGFEPRPYEESGHFIIIDGYSIRAGVKSPERYTTTLQLNDVSINLSNALEKLKGKRRCVVLESLTILLDESGFEKGMIFLRNTVARTRLSHASFITTYNHQAFPPAVSALVQEAVDGTIKLRIEETKQGIVRFVLVPRLRNAKPLPQWIKLSLV